MILYTIWSVQVSWGTIKRNFVTHFYEPISVRLCAFYFICFEAFIMVIWCVYRWSFCLLVFSLPEMDQCPNPNMKRSSFHIVHLWLLFITWPTFWMGSIIFVVVHVFTFIHVSTLLYILYIHIRIHPLVCLFYWNNLICIWNYE